MRLAPPLSLRNGRSTSAVRPGYPGLRSSPADANIRSPMTIYTFQAIRYDEQRPWVVLSIERGSVELGSDREFQTWASHTYPDNYRVLLDHQTTRWPPTEST